MCLGSCCWHYQIQILHRNMHSFAKMETNCKALHCVPFFDLKMSFNDAYMLSKPIQVEA